MIPAVGDAVRCNNPRSHRHGQVGEVIEVILPAVWRGEGPDRVLVSGDPDLRGSPFAWVRYPDGYRTPQDLDTLEVLERADR